MRTAALVLCAVMLVLIPAVCAAESKVPAGTEEIVIDSMCKAKEGAKKKVLKGPVPLKHQVHVEKGATCVDCHHETKTGEAPKPCSECHKDKETGKIIKLDDAFHGGESDTMPALNSCIGCHRRKVYANNASTTAPWQKKPCEACHSLKK